MTTTRVKPIQAEQLHTKEKILAKLDTDLTDSERKGYLQILLDSPLTAHLLTAVADEWEISLIKQQLEIEKLKAMIRGKEIYIENYAEIARKPSIRSDYYRKEIELFQGSLNSDTSKLHELQSAYEKSNERAIQTIEYFGPILEEFKKDIDNKWLSF